MTTWKQVVSRIDEWRFMIPQSYREGMRVPGIIYADEQMMDHIWRENTQSQVANVACLPGIVTASLAMPDIHFGYGFPIGGVAAFDPQEGGVISPGGVGYDINCLSADTQVLHEFGYTIKIKDFEEKWPKERIKCMKLNPGQPSDTDIINFIKIKPQHQVYEIVTASGKKIIATEDHPFYTEYGMLPFKNIKGRIAVYPFEGVPYKEPTDDIIVDEEKIKKLLLELGKGKSGNASRQILCYLRKRNLLPIKFSSWQFPYLLKIAGYVFGDGTMNFLKKNKKGYVWFYGKSEDLEKIREDIKKIGFTPSRVYQRKREHKFKTFYREYRISNIESSVKVGSTAFALLLAALGVPLGEKVSQPYSIPQYLSRAALWQKRLFLAALFGAELTSPKAFNKRNYNFYTPILAMNKKVKFLKNGNNFLRDIANILEEFGVQNNKISRAKSYIGKKGDVSYRFCLILSSAPESLINLWGRVGFEYNREKQYLANLMCHYIRMKEKVKSHREIAARKALKLKQEGYAKQEILDEFKGDIYVNTRFIERSIYEPRKTKVRTAHTFPDFDEFKENVSIGLGKSGMVWDHLYSIQECEEDYVYDFTVEDGNHNFVANNFVVSNCGVRVLRTNLEYKDVKDKIEKITNALAAEVPSGVGSEGPVSLSFAQLDNVLAHGSKWAVKQGYGSGDDYLHTEAQGCLEGANPDKVSRRAKERGLKQSGTLGSGNHFLEVQEVVEIFDEKVAQTFGFFKGQIAIMVHSGSRGLGHQVCTDYITVMNRASQKYGIWLPDRQLCCAPIDSPEGKDYFAAMCAAANYAWANRQLLMHWTREVFCKVVGGSIQALGISLVYDVAHNIAKFERHELRKTSYDKKQGPTTNDQGPKTDESRTTSHEPRLLCVHRKGATRAFPAGHPEIPDDYKSVGQPVIVPGDMGRCSFVLVGTELAMQETFGSVCHGAGREMSRTAALKNINLNELLDRLKGQGIIVRSASKKGLVEEAPEAYKDVRNVVNVVHNAGLAKRVAKMRPLGVVKG
jgi:tRNA-splicing ligase RtcB